MWCSASKWKERPADEDDDEQDDDEGKVAI
jgi:hypothetical protein